MKAAACYPTVTEVKVLSKNLGERYILKHPFNSEKMMAGQDTFYVVLEINIDVSMRNAESFFFLKS